MQEREARSINIRKAYAPLRLRKVLLWRRWADRDAFHDFFFAIIELERISLRRCLHRPNGMPLTLLSLLARLGIDPWAEAKRLAALPSNLTAAALSRSIARALSDARTQSASCSGSGAVPIATRLKALLPQRKPIRSAATWHDWANGITKV